MSKCNPVGDTGMIGRCPSCGARIMPKDDGSGDYFGCARCGYGFKEYTIMPHGKPGFCSAVPTEEETRRLGFLPVCLRRSGHEGLHSWQTPPFTGFRGLVYVPVSRDDGTPFQGPPLTERRVQAPSQTVYCCACNEPGYRGDFHYDKAGDRYACVNRDACHSRQLQRERTKSLQP